jgi:hypothetical protein
MSGWMMLMGGNIVNVRCFSNFWLIRLCPVVVGGWWVAGFGMLLGPEGTSSPWPPSGGGGSCVFCAGCRPRTHTSLLLRRGVFGGLRCGFVGWWVFVNWIVDASIL